MMRYGGDYQYNVSIETRYQKVCFDPRTFNVHTGDRTYATNDLIRPSVSGSMTYGSAASCSDNCCGGNFPGISQVDLCGTIFAVEDSFGPEGWCASSTSATLSSADQVVRLDGDGQCGSIVPIRIRGADGCRGQPSLRTTATDYALRLRPQ